MTVNELRSLLDKMVTAQPAFGELPARIPGRVNGRYLDVQRVVAQLWWTDDDDGNDFVAIDPNPETVRKW